MVSIGYAGVEMTKKMKGRGMKNQNKSDRLKSVVKLAAVISVLVSFNQVQANDNWSNGYIGEPSFELKEDPGLFDKTQKVKEIRSILDKLEKKLKVKQAAFNRAKKLQNSAKSAVEITKKSMNANKAKSGKLKASLTKLEQESATAQNNLTLATASERLTNEELAKVQKKLTELSEKLLAAETSCTATPTPACQKAVKGLKKKVAATTTKKDKKAAIHKLALDSLKAAKKSATSSAQSLKKTKAEIAKLKTQNETLKTTLATQSVTLKNASAVAKTAKEELKPVAAKFKRSTELFNAARDDRSDYRQRLITRIIQLNARGAEVGHRHGLDDGDYYAEYVGVDEGRNDGDFDGTNEGRTEGLRREYNRGSSQGALEGEALANEEGERDGIREGTIAGNIVGATNNGLDDGERRANDSDASDVGTAQGKRDGFVRAQREGKIEGYAIGKAQGIEKFETVALETKTVPGKFIGAFSAQVPGYPGFNCKQNGRSFSNNICPEYNPRQNVVNNIRRHVVKRAFIDGYNKRYRQARRREFLRNIADIYLTTYNENHAAAFEYFSNLEYPEERERGRIDGHRSAYDHYYPLVRADFFEKYKSEFTASPDTDADEYKTTYARVELETYNTVYEEIRKDFYDRFEQSTFDNNIEKQVDIFRLDRLAQVVKIYTENPVLKYESSSLFDSGISGIAKNDGVFQPGEDVIHTIVVKNFGLVAETGARVKLTSGETVSLPTIPAQSVVTIKGAAKTLISSATPIHSVKKLGLTVQSPLTAEALIQGRHFCSVVKKELTCLDVKKINVEFPLSLAGLSTTGPLLLGMTNKLSINVSNNSKRNYEGPLTVSLNVNSGSEIITKSFDTIDSLANFVKLQSAEVTVNDEQDIFTPLSFKAVVSKNGVQLGTLERSLETMAKSAFINKVGQSVIVVNSERDTQNLLAVLDQFGGVKNIGVLDLSLGSQNTDTLTNGLKSKKAILVGEAAINGLNTILKSTENSIFFTLTRGAFSAVKSQRALKDSFAMPVVLNGLAKNQEVLFTNPYRASLKASNAITRIGSDDIAHTVSLFNDFTKSNDLLIAQVDKTMNKDSFFKSNSLMKVINLKTLAELMVVNKSYLASGRNNQFADMIENGNRLLLQKVLATAGTKANKKKIGIQMTAITLNKLFRKLEREFTPMSDDISFKISNRIRGRLSDTMGATILWAKKKLLKTFKKMDKKTYKKLAKEETVNLPLDLVTYFDEDSRPDTGINN